MANPIPGQPLVPTWRWMGERGIRLATGDATLAHYHKLLSGYFPELDDIIPADGSILLILKVGASLSDSLRAALVAPPAACEPASATRHAIPVEFGGVAGPDLSASAARAGLTEADYLERLAATEFTVAFLGFQPGFPYLCGLPPELSAPRRASPRTRVAAGSVAVGGGYVGIYPAAGPGGWQLLGRTPLRLFDPARAQPALLQPGDRVRFVPVSA